MEAYLHKFSIYFITLFFCIDVIGMAPIYISMTSHFCEKTQVKIVNKGVIAAFCILFVFAISGLQILNLFGITLEAFKIAGGILLLLLAIEMVLGKAHTPEKQEEGTENECDTDVAIFPVAMPLLSGPASISLLIMFMKQAGGDLIKQCLIIIALILNMIICWLVLRYANKITKILGRTGINVITKIFGILMSALACQLMISGIGEAFKLT